jgi:hypothetical protein
MANINEYKKTHKPVCNEKSKYKQGTYIPINTSKVIGGAVIYRSSWEEKLARWCDLSPSVIKWGTEVVAIQYRDPGSVNLEECRKYGLNPGDPSQWPIKNYYIDFYIEFFPKGCDENDGKVERVLIEVKPLKETQPPQPVSEGAKLKEKKRFNEAAKTYLRNREKWKAAQAYADKHGVKFAIWTEKSLKMLGVENY